MKYFIHVLLFCFTTILIGCQDNEQQQIADLQKAEKLNDSILKVIDNNWKFNIPQPNAKVAERLNGWNEWHQFINELTQEPSNSISSYRQKAKNLVAKSEELKKNIPESFKKPAVLSRIGVLNTKVKSLYTYITVDVIPRERVVKLIKEITHDTGELQNQFEEIIRLIEIPKEQGEEEMLRALDTVRLANPNAIPKPATPVTPQKNTNTPPPPGHGSGYTEPN